MKIIPRCSWCKDHRTACVYCLNKEIVSMQAEIEELKSDTRVGINDYRTLRQSHAELTYKYEQLKTWKESAMQSFDEWDKVWEYLEKPGSLGKSKALNVLTYLKEKENEGVRGGMMSKEEIMEKVALKHAAKTRMIEILRTHGIMMSVGGCGCCGSPWVRFQYKGEDILLNSWYNVEPDCDFDMFEEEE